MDMLRDGLAVLLRELARNEKSPGVFVAGGVHWGYSSLVLFVTAGIHLARLLLYSMALALGWVLACWLALRWCWRGRFYLLAFRLGLARSLLYLMVSAPGLVLIVPVGVVLVLVCSSFDLSFVLLLARVVLDGVVVLDSVSVGAGGIGTGGLFVIVLVGCVVGQMGCCCAAVVAVIMGVVGISREVLTAEVEKGGREYEG